MHCDVGSLTLKGMEVADAERLYHAARKSSDVEKKARKKKRATKKGFQDKATDAEEVTNCAGGF